MTLQPPKGNIELRPGEELTSARLSQLLADLQANQDFICQQFPISGANLGAPAKKAATLPTKGLFIGKQVIYKAAEGLWWNFVYTAESVEYPWSCIGPVPWLVEAAGSVSTKEKTAQVLAGGPSLVLPLKGDYVVRFGARETPATNESSTIYLYWNGSAKQTTQGGYTGGTNGAQVNGGRPVKLTATEAGKTLELRYSGVFGNEAGFVERWLEAIPVRVG